MWKAVGLVSSGLTLVAFLAAVAAWIYRQKSLQKQKLIETAPEEQRRSLVLAALEFFNVDTSNLTKSQQFDLALQQIKARATRFKISAIIVGIVTVLLALLSVFAITSGNQRSNNGTNQELMREQAQNALLEQIADPDSPPIIRQKAFNQLKDLKVREFPRCNFNRLDLREQDFQGMLLRGSTFNDADLTGAQLKNANLDGATFLRAKLVRADLSDANLNGARLSDADLQEAILSRASIADAILGPDIAFESGRPAIELKPANLHGAKFDQTNFDGSDLKGVDLRGLDLSSSTGLIRHQIDSARTDATTVLPDGLMAADP